MKLKKSHAFQRNSTLRRKLILIYVLISIIPTLLITVIANIIYTQNISRQADSLVEQNSNQHEFVVKERMNQYENVLYELVINKEYIKLASAINKDTSANLLIDKAHMESILESFVYTYDGIRSVTFLADNNEYVSYSKWYGSSNEIIWSNSLLRKQVHDEVVIQQELTFMGALNLSNTKELGDYVILMGLPIRDLRTKEQSGVLVIALEDAVLLFDGIASSDNRVTTVIIDQNNKILAGTEEKYVNKKVEYYLDDKFQGKKISKRINEIEGTEWTILNVIDIELQRKDIYPFISIVVIITVSITCIFFIIVYFISRKYIADIKTIAQGIKQFGGGDGYTATIELDDKDELYVIASQFNKMTKRVNCLVDALKQRNEDIKIAAMNQKHAEIKALEAQINPHFLFNTLDSINWRAIEHEEEEISDMLGALGSLLRYSVSNIDMVVVLAAEIAWIKKYVFLQRDRFQNSFDCIYEVSQEAMGFPIYKMLLQPIMENIIIHGFEEVKEGGLIKVKAIVMEDHKLKIIISDNGSGMSEEKLSYIRDEINNNGVLNLKGIGISNVIHRLKMYYQDDCRINVTSKLGQGTEFILVIPNQNQS